MTAGPINRFVAAAAAAYRETGVRQAGQVADLLAAHEKAAFSIVPATAPATRHLDSILNAGDLHPAARPLGSAIKILDWTEGELPMPISFKGKFAFVTLIGEGTSVPDDRFYFGLYMQAPNAYYPSHWHRAEELYYVLSGTASWQQGTSQLAPKPPGTLIHHGPDEPHIMETHGAPLLAMWAWIGDLDPKSYRIDPG
ncbi:MAG: dimethylsulfonioproprionate lyase family protein [Hyphomicrobiaceae bacterium]